MTKAQITFMIEELTKDLVKNLMEEQNISMQKALEIVYTSETFDKLSDPNTGLYFQSTPYVYEYLTKEMKLGSPLK